MDDVVLLVIIQHNLQQKTKLVYINLSLFPQQLAHATGHPLRELLKSKSLLRPKGTSEHLTVCYDQSSGPCLHAQHCRYLTGVLSAYL